MRFSRAGFRRIATSQVLNETTKTYGPNYTVDRDRMREFSLFAQDTWKVNSNLTLTLGVRWDKQNPFENLDGLYTSVGLAGLYGVSGVGNLFKPGVLSGTSPVFTPRTTGRDSYQSRFGNFNPNIGLAYRIAHKDGPLSWLTGKGDAVLRGGFSIATIREGMGFLAGVLTPNQGRSLSTSVDPINFPSNFGPIGSVSFGGPYPTRAPTAIDPNFPNPSFPLAVQSGQSVEDYNPNIKPEYVESWTFGFQRQLDKNTGIDIRYVGTHGVGSVARNQSERSEHRGKRLRPAIPGGAEQPGDRQRIYEYRGASERGFHESRFQTEHQLWQFGPAWTGSYSDHSDGDRQHDRHHYGDPACARPGRA